MGASENQQQQQQQPASQETNETSNGSNTNNNASNKGSSTPTNGVSPTGGNAAVLTNGGGANTPNHNNNNNRDLGFKGNEDRLGFFELWNLFFYFRKIFVGGIAYDVNNDDLATYFSQFGDVTQAQVKFDRASGRSRGFAFVEFANAEACKLALNQREQQIKNKQCEIKPAKSREVSLKLKNVSKRNFTEKRRFFLLKIYSNFLE